MRTHPSWHCLFRVVLLAATLCGASPGSALAGLDPASVRETPLGPPVALRTDLVLDRAALEGFGVPRPSALAFDGEGALYILDASSRRVVKVDPSGKLLHSVGGYGDDPASLTLPEEIIVDRRESLLVLDRARGALIAFDRAGSFLASRPFEEDLAEATKEPGARLLLDVFGRFWVLLPRERDLVPLDDRLRRARTARFLTPEDGLREPALVSPLPGGDGWLYDAGARALRRFRSSGALGAPPDTASIEVSALATDRAGYLYAADPALQRVFVIDPRGGLVFERVLGGPGAPWVPTAVAWSRLDRVAVADRKRGEVQVLSVVRGATP
jgi:DNA-binding beta-propeller fold protein YncE